MDRVVICHCATCRRSAGAQSVAWAVARPDQVRVSGEGLRWYQSTPNGRRGFCTQCGSSLFFVDADDDSEMDVSASTFDDPEVLPRPSKHVWVPSKLSWVALEPGLSRHVEGSFSPEANG